MRFTNRPTRISVALSKNATNEQQYIPHFTCLYGSQKSQRPKIKLAPKLTERVIVSVINRFFFLLIKSGAPTARNVAAAACFPELHSARNHICPDSGTSCPALHVWERGLILNCPAHRRGHSWTRWCLRRATPPCQLSDRRLDITDNIPRMSGDAGRAEVSPRGTRFLHLRTVHRFIGGRNWISREWRQTESVEEPLFQLIVSGDLEEPFISLSLDVE